MLDLHVQSSKLAGQRQSTHALRRPYGGRGREQREWRVGKFHKLAWSLGAKGGYRRGQAVSITLDTRLISGPVIRGFYCAVPLMYGLALFQTTSATSRPVSRP